MNKPEDNFDVKQYYNQMHKMVLDTSNNEYQKFMLENTEEIIMKKLKHTSKTQMRNVFELIKACDSFHELNMTKPKLIYTAGRLNGEAKKFLLELAKLVTKAKDENDLNAIKKFIETVLAYHKYYALN